MSKAKEKAVVAVATSFKGLEEEQRPQPPTEEQIRFLAFLKWENGGQPFDKEEEVRFWLEAEQELTQSKE